MILSETPMEIRQHLILIPHEDALNIRKRRRKSGEAGYRLTPKAHAQRALEAKNAPGTEEYLLSAFFIENWYQSL